MREPSRTSVAADIVALVFSTILFISHRPSWALSEKPPEPSQGQTIEKADPLEEGPRISQSSASLAEIRKSKKATRAYLEEKYGSKWMVDFDRPLERFNYIRGEVPYYTGTDELEEARKVAERFLHESAVLLAVDIGELKLITKRDSDDVFYFDYIQKKKGAIVENGKLFVQVKKDGDDIGPVVGIVNHTHPNITVSTEPRLTPEAAVKEASDLNKALLSKLEYRDADD